MSDITRIDTGTRMSQAVIHNGTVYLAGQVGEPGTSVTEQTKSILAKIEAQLAEAEKVFARLTRWVSRGQATLGGTV